MKVKKSKPQEKAPEVDQVAAVKAVKSVDGSIFQCFKDLTSDTENVRINAGLNLLQLLSKSQDKEKREKEYSYCLKRLVRGAGASTSSSRTGFYTTLLAFLQTTNSEEMTVQQILDTIEKELHVGVTISNKEDADAIVGKILVCAAIIRSGKLAGATTEEVEKIANILIQSARYRSYHSSLSFTFIIAMIQAVTPKQFEDSIWPQLQGELAKPWQKQTLPSVYCVIEAHRKFPSVLKPKFFKSHFGGAELLNTESGSHLLKLFWGSTNSDILTHPGLEAFGRYLATCSGLGEFWAKQVDPYLGTPNKLQEIITLKISTDVLSCLDIEKTSVSSLLTPNFIKMIVASLKNAKTKKDETLKAFYDEFFENMSLRCSKATDEECVSVIRKLILHPGTFSIEKYTPNRIVHQLIGFLGEKGVQTIFSTYKDIFLDRVAKNPENKTETWLNFERQNAAYMLQHLLSHKSVQNSFTWRREQLEFFMTVGLFNVNNSGEVCTRNEASELQREFGTHMKNIFYASLQSKVPALKDEKAVLVSLVETCNTYLQKKNPGKYFRQKIDDKILKAWNEMYTEIKKKKKVEGDEKKLQLVFHILLLHMGFQLFREPEMAETAILDLEKCMTMTKSKKKSSSEAEPEWIEVVIDLFLHLLSQNASALRNIVNTVFPHLCGSLNLSAMHQILSMLDMKDGHNPLSAKGEDEEEEEEDEDDDEEKDEASDDDEDDDDDESGSEDDDEDEEVEDEDEDEDVTDADKLRNAVSLALGAAVPHDDDQDSIDLNDMTEEEGRKLDEALSAAFKAMKKPGSSQNKKSKSHRVQTTTVMHFRTRVLDLIEIYIQQEPSLLVTIEIMLALFNMLEFCTDDEQKPLQTKVEKTLNKLTALRQFGSTQDVTEANMVDFIRMIIDKKSRSIAFDIHNRLKNKCCMFLIANAKLMSAKGENGEVLSLLTEYLEDFIKSRNPAVNITLLSDIFKLRWQGVWVLASTLTKKGISESTRTFRRIQVVELLTSVYKNHELIKQDESTSKKCFKTIETVLSKHLQVISKSPTVSVKEFNTLLELLFVAHRCHTKFSNDNSILAACTERVQEIRSRVKLDSAQSYHRFCNAYKVKPLKNAVAEQNGKQNGHAAQEELDEDDEQASSKQNGKKRKPTNAVSSKKEKKLKKQERMKAFSEGLNGGFNFDVSTAEDVVMSDGPPNEDSSSDSD